MPEAGTVVSRKELAQMQSLPLQAKIIKSLRRIEEWLNYWDGLAYVSYSGGKDSEVLLWLARQVDSSIPAVFLNTRMEYPEIVRHVGEHENVTTIFPPVTPLQVVRRWGYPVVSKQVSRYVREIRSPNTSLRRREQLLYVGKEPGRRKFRLPYEWRFLLEAPFAIDDICCKKLKEEPVKVYEKATGRKPIIGVKAEDSLSRQQSYLSSGCNSFYSKRPRSAPISFWSDVDVFTCIRENDIPLCPAYGKILEGKPTGLQSTGCSFCTLGMHLEPYPNRMQQLCVSNPKLYEVVLEKFGFREVLDFLGLAYVPGQINNRQRRYRGWTKEMWE